MLLLRLRELIYTRFYKSGNENRQKVASLTLWLAQKAAFAIGFFSSNLSLLALLCGTDKIGGHQYAPIYQTLFAPLRWKKISLLEIGVGGYSHHIGGGSLKMWQSFFRRGSIYGIDLYDKTGLSKGRIEVHQCSQDDDQGLRAIAEKVGPFDIIIDDGSHINAHQIKSFQALFYYLKDGGVYAVEDVQTSYWPSAGGGGIDSNKYSDSCMYFFKQLVDSVNMSEFLDKAGNSEVLDPSIGNISFHHNLILITKNNTPEKSNINIEDPSVRATLLKSQDMRSQR